MEIPFNSDCLVKIHDDSVIGSGIVVSTLGYILTCRHNVYPKHSKTMYEVSVTTKSQDTFQKPIDYSEGNITSCTRSHECSEFHDICVILCPSSHFENIPTPKVISAEEIAGQWNSYKNTKVFLLAYDEKSKKSFRCETTELTDIEKGDEYYPLRFRLKQHGFSGMSGGGLFNTNGNLIGILAKIDNDRNNEIIAHAIPEKFRDWITIPEPKNHKKSQETIDPKVLEKAKREFQALVRNNIAEILEMRSSSPLRQILIRKTSLSPDSTPEEIAEKLTAYDLDEAIGIFVESVKRSLGVAEDCVGCWANSKEIMGWLILLAIKYEWVYPKKIVFTDSKRILFDEENNLVKLKIPTETEVGLEIVFSVMTDRFANFDVDEPGSHPNCPTGHKYDFIEYGVKRNDHVHQIKQNIKKMIGYTDDLKKSEKYNDDVLNGILRLRKNHFYLIVDVDVDSSKIPDLYRQLKEDLSQLNILFMSSSQQQEIFDIPERQLIGILIEFFKLKQG